MTDPAVIPRLLVLFTSSAARERSCFAAGERSWVDRTDAGPVRYEAWAIDREEPFAGPALAAVLLLEPDQIQPPTIPKVSALLDRLRDQRTAIDLIADGSPMEALAWINRHLPRRGDCLRADGEVRPDLPSFWRRWAESRLQQHLAGPDPSPRPRSHTDQEGSGMFSLEAMQKFLAGRR